MKYFLFSLLAFTSLHAYAQQGQVVFGSAENEENYPMIRLPNGDYLFAGMTQNPGFGGKDVLVTRTNPGGNILWSKQFGGAGDETAFSVAQTPDSGFVIGGETFSGDPDGDAFVLKVDANGNMIWWKNYGRSLYDCNYSVIALADGSIVSAGLMESGPLDFDAFLMKTDANGDTLWTKVIGGPGIEHAVNLIQTADSGYIFCGKSLSVGQGYCDCWLVKTDSNGDTLWTCTIGGAGWDESMDIIEQPGGYIVCGGSNSEGFSDYDFILMKVDLQGNLTWVKQYGGIHVEDSYCVQEVPGEGYVLCGYTETYAYDNSRGTDSANAWLLKTDYNGDTLWSMVYGGGLKEECFSVALVPGGGYSIAGYTGSFGDSLQTYLFMTDTAGYSGCLERRTHPTTFSPAFVTGRYLFAVTRGYTVTAPSISQMVSGVQDHNVCIPMSVSDETQTENVLIFPNPSDAHFTVHATKVISEIRVFDIQGQLVDDYILPSILTNYTYPAPSSSGTYIVEIAYADGSVVREKLMVSGTR